MDGPPPMWIATPITSATSSRLRPDRGRPWRDRRRSPTGADRKRQRNQLLDPGVERALLVGAGAERAVPLITSDRFPERSRALDHALLVAR